MVCIKPSRGEPQALSSVFRSRVGLRVVIGPRGLQKYGPIRLWLAIGAFAECAMPLGRLRKPYVVSVGSMTVASGSRRVKHEPSPGVPRSSRVPPCWEAIQLAIARPSPVPVAAVALRPR
jgi:hypothetical protein